MHDAIIDREPEPLDGALALFLEKATLALRALLDETLSTLGEEPEGSERLNLLRWAIMYSVALGDVSRGARLLLNDGKHNRTVLMLRRAAFEYRTRFHFFRRFPEHATTAMNLFRSKSEMFARRVGPNQVTFIQDSTFDFDQHQTALKSYPNFERMCDLVFGDDGQDYYARFYSYPSSLLHGDAMMSMSILKIDSDHQGVYLSPPGPSTNEIAGNLVVFLMDFAIDVAEAFDLQVRRLLNDIGHDFNLRRKALCQI